MNSLSECFVAPSFVLGHSVPAALRVLGSKKEIPFGCGRSLVSFGSRQAELEISDPV